MSSAISAARDLLVREAGGFLRNVTWRAGVNCGLCAGIWDTGFTSCYHCPSWSMRTDLASRLGFVTYAVEGQQSGHIMYGYKAPIPSHKNHQAVDLMNRYAIIRHWNCLNQSSLGPLTHWATVPSVSKAGTSHPLHQINARLFGTTTLPDVGLATAAEAVKTRGLRPENFTVPHRIDNAHVLLIEDTWVTGGSAQSAAAALKRAGARAVTLLVIARWLDLRRGETRSFASTLTSQFDPDACPFTGQLC